MHHKYIHMTEAERRRIERLRSAGKGVRVIARTLGRGIGTVSEEIKRNSVHGEYHARKAEHKAYVRRKYAKADCLKVTSDTALRCFVEEKLREEWSPEGIAGRLKEQQRVLPYASAKAIYKFVYSPYGRQVEKCLYSRSVKKKSGPKRNRSIWEDGRKSIATRPKHIENRRTFGHFEGDFIESGRDGTGSALVLVERKTRYPFLRYTEDRTTEAVNRLVTHTLSGVPVESMTVDNDVSLQKHRELSLLIGADIFFCHPQCPQEKGTVENRNKAIRRYLPKRIDLSRYREQFTEIERKLRTRPMKCLNWRTPQEAWDDEMRKRTTKKPQRVCGMMVGVLKTNNGSVRLRGFV